MDQATEIEANGPERRAVARRAGDHQAVRGLRRQRPRRPRPGARRNPRPARRERGRQVDAGQDPLRAAEPHRGRNPVAGRAGRPAEPQRRPRARHRHGLPAFLAVRQPHGGRERRAGAAEDRAAGDAARPHRRNLPRLRLLPRTEPPGLFALRRRAPAHRNRALPVAGPEGADPRRTDLGADAARSGAAVRDVAAAEGRGQGGALHLPPSRGGAAAVRPRDDPQARQSGRLVRSRAPRPPARSPR